MQNETILVTGGCGYIGSHVVKKLSESGQKVVVIDNLATGFREALLHGEPLFTHSVQDVALTTQVLKEFKVSAVIHFAASLIVPESVANPLKYYENNVLGIINLIKSMKAAGTRRLIFSSTASVYGSLHQQAVDESAAVRPENPYASSKLMSEQIIHDFTKSDQLSYAILRYFNVAGADPDLKIGQRTKNATHLIKVGVEAALGKRPYIEVFGTDYPTPDGTGVRDYIHVSDLASAHISSLAYLKAGGASRIFNCGYGHGYSVLEVIHTIEKVTGRKLDVRMQSRRPGDVATLIANTKALQEATAWRPSLDSLETIIASAWEWEKKLSTLEASGNNRS